MPFRSARGLSAIFSKSGTALVAIALFFPFISDAAVTVAPPTPYAITSAGTIYYAGERSSHNPTPDSSFVDEGDGFHFFDLDAQQGADTGSANIVYLDVSSSKTFGTLAANENIVVTVVVNNSVAVPIAYASEACSSGARCQSNVSTSSPAGTYSLAVRYDHTNKETLRIGLYPQDICAYAAQVGATVTGCAGGALDTAPNTRSLAVTIYISKEQTDGGTGTVSSSEENKQITLQFQQSAPTLSCIADLSVAYSPGDSEIFFSPGSFTSAADQYGAPLSKLIFLAKEGGTNPTNFWQDTSQIVARLEIGGAASTIEGFTNTTDGTDHLYDADVGVRDAAGVVNSVGDFCFYPAAVQTSQIQGFLRQGNCFVATAAFRSTDAAPVELLREFRDHVLSKSFFGQIFIQRYYEWSPSAAEWLMRNPEFRGPVLLWLAPVQILAWLALHPAVFLCLCLTGMLLLYVPLRQRRSPRFLGFFGVLAMISTLLVGVHRAYAVDSDTPKNVQPYLDELKSQMAPSAAPSEPGVEPYIESLRKKIKSSGSATGSEKGSPEPSYLEELKASNPERFKSSGEGSYTEWEKLKLEPKTDGGAIRSVAEGESELRPKKVGEISGAFGLRVGVNQGRTITSENAVRPYDEIYSPGLAPDLSFFYEYQPFHSEWLGNVGLFGSLGVSFQKGSGIFEFEPSNPGGGTYGSVSSVKFQFITVPATLGLTYRFNLFRVLRPFVMAGPTLVGFSETRSDNKDAIWGNSRGMTVGGGVAFNLDWLSRDSSWSLYETFGVMQYFLTLDFLRFSTLSGPVNFTNSTTSLGLTFEI